MVCSALTSEKRRGSDLHSQSHKSSLPHPDAVIAAAAAEGARMVQQMSPPNMESTRRRISEFQVLLCLLGALLSASVSLWTAGFSKDTLGRRMLISGIAALCAFIFVLLSYAAFKKRRRKDPIDDIEISQSILREHRKSLQGSLRRSTVNGDEFIQQIRRHSSVMAVDAARQQHQLLVQQANKGANASATAHHNLLSVESPPPKQVKRASTPN